LKIFYLTSRSDFFYFFYFEVVIKIWNVFQDFRDPGLYADVIALLFYILDKPASNHGFCFYVPIDSQTALGV